MSKAYFFSSPYKGCSYLRCLLPQLHGGYNGSLSSLYGDLKEVKTVVSEAMRAPVTVFHRPDRVEAHKIAIELKKLGNKIVFDNDDTFKLEKGNPFMKKDFLGSKVNEKTYSNILDNFIYNADAVTTTTEFLAKEYRELNDNVHVLPNCVDPDDWPEPKRNEGKKIRIGLVGSVTYSHDFSVIKSFIRELSEREDIQLVMFGLQDKKLRKESKLAEKAHHEEYKFWDSLKNLEHVPWVQMGDYFEALNDLKLDIMLIPRTDNYFNKCKSNVKYLEASMLEIPVVAQSFSDGNSPYDGDLDGSNGLLANSEEEWREQTELLISSKAIRRGMGRKAKEYVLANYHIEQHVDKWEKLFNSLIN